MGQLERDFAAANGIIQATKEAFEEEKLKYVKELDEEREKAKNYMLEAHATIDKLQREVSKCAKSAGPAVIPQPLLDPNEEHTPDYFLKVILNDLKERRRENECLALKVEYEQKMRNLDGEHQSQMAALKTHLKRVFNLDLQNLKLSYEHDIKQIKMQMKKQDEEKEQLRGELVKKESEISLLREKNKHFDSERRMWFDHAEFLAKVPPICETICSCRTR